MAPARHKWHYDRPAPPVMNVAPSRLSDYIKLINFAPETLINFVGPLGVQTSDSSWPRDPRSPGAARPSLLGLGRRLNGGDRSQLGDAETRNLA